MSLRRVAAAAALAVFVGAGTLLWYQVNRPQRTPVIEPAHITASGPRFDSVEEMAAASDLVLVGRVIEVGPGRALGDPGDPDVGIRTQLVSFEVAEVIQEPVGITVGANVVIEQEAELLDGTPMIVNGLEPLALGDRGVVFLIEGDGADYPYTALVNEQGWVPSESPAAEAELVDRLAS